MMSVAWLEFEFEVPQLGCCWVDCSEVAMDSCLETKRGLKYNRSNPVLVDGPLCAR